MKNVTNVVIIVFVLFSIFCEKNQQIERTGERQPSAAMVPVPNIDWFISNLDADTFKISTADELAGLANIVNNMAEIGQSFNFNDRTIVLVENIDLSDYGKNYRRIINTGKSTKEINGWISIGAGLLQDAFSGTFDGNGKTVRGLFIEGTASKNGLFGWVANGGIVKNLTMENININAANNVGAVAGIVYGDGSKVINCSASGTIRGKIIVGGVVGAAEIGAIISNCYFMGTVRGENAVGGVVGTVGSNSRVIDSYSLGKVNGKEVVGGVVGNIESNSSVKNSYSVSVVYGESSVGGVIGRVFDTSTVSNCYSMGTVSGGNAIGGVAGAVMTGSELSNSYATGEVTGNVSIGGVVGGISTGGSVSNSYSIGKIRGKGSVGGLVGHIDHGSVISCAALNSSVKSTGLSFGRVVGNIVGDLESSKLSNNIAFNNMVNISDSTLWLNKSINKQNGADINATEIKSDPTLGGRFISENGWMIQNNYLPGFGKPVIMPPHLCVGGFGLYPKI